MKPFNLEEALAGKPVKLRDGRKAYVRHHETELDVSADYKLLGYAVDGEQLSWSESGSYLSEMTTSDYSIIGMYPETKVINGFEVPVPETVAPEYNTRYYLVRPTKVDFHSHDFWVDAAVDKIWLERGLVFLNKEGAIATAKAMLGIDPNTGEEEE